MPGFGSPPGQPSTPSSVIVAPSASSIPPRLAINVAVSLRPSSSEALGVNELFRGVLRARDEDINLAVFGTHSLLVGGHVNVRHDDLTTQLDEHTDGVGASFAELHKRPRC